MNQTNTTSSNETIRGIVAGYAAAESWWADLFLSNGLSAEEVAAYMSTSLRVKGAPLCELTSAGVMSGLKEYARTRGVAGDGPSSSVRGEGRFRFVVRQAVTLVERDAIFKEVQSFCCCEFSPRPKVAYADHTAAQVVRQISYAWLRSLVFRGGKVLEVGANVTGLVYAGVDPERYHGYCPVLGARDAGRHSAVKAVETVARGGSQYTSAQVRAARVYMEDPSALISRCRIEEDDRPAEYIVSNHSDYDIDLDDVPSIMAKHKARVWYGSVLRAKGAGSAMGRVRGEIAALGARYEIDRGADRIEFHFKGRASFAYAHSYSSYMKREERNDYRWVGLYHDYVYTRLPATTENTLFYAIYRVRKLGSIFVEPRYLATGAAGLVRVHSVRAVTRGGAWFLEPFTFELERLALDKVLEYRRKLGVQGKVQDTLYYLRSVRVTFYLNGTAVGALAPVDTDILESCAVFVEVYVSVTRRADEMDISCMLGARRGAERTSWLSSVAASLRGLVVARSTVRSSLGRWRVALEALADSRSDLSFRVEPCPEYVAAPLPPVSSGVEDSLEGGACVCRELEEVRSALADPDEYTRGEQRMLQKYLVDLEGRRGECACVDAVDCYLDSFVPAAEVSDSGYASEGTSADEFFECREAPCDADVVLGDERADAVREYANIVSYVDKATVERSERTASLVFSRGVPHTSELARFSTARCRVALVRVENERVTEVTEGKVDEVGALVRRDTLRLVKTRTSRKNAIEALEVPDGWHYSSSELRILNGDRLSATALSVLGGEYGFSGVATMELPFIVGPFGSGKTRTIVQEMYSLLVDGVDVGYISATVSSVQKVMEALVAKGWRGDLSAVCVTMDSTLCRTSVKRRQVLYIDEAPMAHAGEIFTSLSRIGPRQLKMYGDFAQIPYCAFTAEVPSVRADLSQYATIVGRLRELHRCPADVLAAWDDVYDGTLIPCSCCEHVRSNTASMAVRRIPSISSVPVKRGVRYLTFTQREKQELVAHLGFSENVEALRLRVKDGLATVHEDQGGTYDEVILVRSNVFFDPKESKEFPAIYNRRAYALVAMTRHKKEFSYYTASVERDEVVRRIEGVTEEGIRCVLSREILKEKEKNAA